MKYSKCRLYGRDTCQNFDFQIALNKFLFYPVYGRLHGLIRACLSDSHAYKVAVPFMYCIFYKACMYYISYKLHIFMQHRIICQH